VSELYANLSAHDFVYLRHLAVLSPDTQVYSNLSPSMLYYEGTTHPVDITIGKDSAYYHPQSAHVFWDEEVQPFGYDGVIALLQQLEAALERRTDG
jgi:nitrogenase molybdenum-cofactor synthesis protein NifE